MIKDTNSQQYTISTYNTGLDSWTSPQYHGPGDQRVAPLLDLTAKRPSLFRREIFGDWMLAERARSPTTGIVGIVGTGTWFDPNYVLTPSRVPHGEIKIPYS